MFLMRHKSILFHLTLVVESFLLISDLSPPPVNSLKCYTCDRAEGDACENKDNWNPPKECNNGGCHEGKCDICHYSFVKGTADGQANTTIVECENFEHLRGINPNVGSCAGFTKTSVGEVKSCACNTNGCNPLKDARQIAPDNKKVAMLSLSSGTSGVLRNSSSFSTGIMMIPILHYIGMQRRLLS